MITRAMLIITLAFGLVVAAVQPKVLRAQSQPTSADPTFRDFTGVNHTPAPDIGQQLSVGWVRNDMAWPNLEPQKGKWAWGGEDHLIASVQDQGLQFLPILDYTPLWAASVQGNNKSAPKNVQDWEDFVEQAVSRYSAAPYNLRYFQVWNEPTRQATFWTGTDQEFVDLIYLPAAKIIRRHNCYVVFGGWPSSNSLQEFDQVLNYHDAWRWTDIVDVHYRDLPSWQHLCNEWVRTGKCRGLWQSEVGDTKDVSTVPRLYLEALYIALQSGWTDPNQYKIFWFQVASGGPTADQCLSKPGPSGQLVLTEHGIHLKVLNDLLGGSPLSSFSAFTTRPPLPPSVTTVNSTALGFKVGADRVVIGLILIRDQTTQSISVRMRLPHQPTGVRVVSAGGEQQEVKADYRGGYLNVDVPRAGLEKDGVSLIGYLQLDGI